jgi:hypothetical protein
MAKDIMGYARQNVAQARYARRPSTTPQRRATIDPTLFSGKKAATGAPLASRPIEGGTALPSPQEYNPIIDAESGEDPNAPRVETQQPIENRGGSARYMLQTGGPKIDLSFLVPERANEAYDPSKAIGGDNVPYQESKGIGGFFRRFLGDESNRMNIEAQQAQGAEWRAEAKAEKERANKMTDRLAEIEALDKGPAARFAATEKRLDDKAIQDEIERENAIDLGLVKEGNEDVLRDADMVRKEALAIEEGKRRDRELDIRESAIKPPRYSPIGNTGMFQTPEGELAVFEPEIMHISDKMPGRAARFRMLTGEGIKAPGRSMGDVEVDRITNKPIVKTPPPAPAPENTAIVPRFMRGAGEVVGEGVQSFMDPLRSGATGLNQLLFNSGAQQDPEVLKRMEERTRRNPLRNPSIAIPMGY